MSALHYDALFGICGAETPAVIDRSRANDAPTQISVRIWVVDIKDIDSAQQGFTAEIAILLRWKDSL